PLAVSTRISTAWTFRSTGPTGTGSVRLPLLSVDYALPLDTANRPVGGPARVTVHQVHGGQGREVTAFGMGRDRLVDGPFQAGLPRAATEQPVSLRVRARGSGGSGGDQMIIRAYRA